MTANEMANEFDIKLDIISSQSTPGLLDSEKSVLLTSAEEIVFQKQFPPDAPVDTTEILKKKLSTMYVNTTLSAASSQSGAYTNGDFWALPANHYYTLNLFANMASDTDCLNGKDIGIKPITYDEYNTNISNPFKNPGKGVVWALQAGFDSDEQRIQTIHSSDFTSINTLSIAYIKNVEGITVDVNTPANQVNSLLPTILHMEIVDEAVELAKLQLGLLNEFQTQAVYNEANK